ncbi:MAG: hypothetical protein WC595_06250, partial [Candidatus Nanoarchaeia archaeon]
MNHEKRMIDPRNFDLESSRGHILFFLGQMGVGKTEEVITFLRKAHAFSDARAMAFGHNLDTKAGQARISSRTQDYFPAIKCNTASEITERVTEADKDGEFVDIVAIDEVLYFGYDLFPALLQLTNEGRVVALSSVDRDYRNEPIQLVQDIASLSRTTCLPSSAYCQ